MLACDFSEDILVFYHDQLVIIARHVSILLCSKECHWRWFNISITDEVLWYLLQV